ncbi:MAG: hypothetical protein LAO79_12450 [Acidobacteriia bacterium]|nr:hypothetical protein [Terriglobia bacterium]
MPPKTIYATFHGGKPTGKDSTPIWYVESYTQVNGTWQPNSNALALPAPSGSDGYQLRDIRFAADGHFYVVNSLQTSSVVWRIPQTGVDPNKGLEVFTSIATIAGLDHPFAIVFDSSLHACFISAQDTNVVFRAFGPQHSKSGAAMPVNAAIPGSNFLAGTFVASELGIAAPGSSAKPPDVKGSEGGLHFLPKSGPPLSHSMRGMALVGTTLYVADEAGNEVKTYDVITGEYLGKISDPNNEIDTPVHLLASGGKLYISDNDSVLCYDPSAGTLTSLLAGLDSPAGMSFDAEGNFYVASRKGNSINGYTSNFQPMQNPLIPGLKDNPEFILCVAHRAARSGIR